MEHENLLEELRRVKCELEDDMESINNRIDFLIKHPEVQEYQDIVHADNDRRMRRRRLNEIRSQDILEQIPTEQISKQ